MKKTFTNLTFKLPDVISFFFLRQKSNEVIVPLYLKVFSHYYNTDMQTTILCIQITLINAIWYIYIATGTDRQHFYSDQNLFKVNEHFENKYWFLSNVWCLSSCFYLMFVSLLAVRIYIFSYYLHSALVN